MSETQNVEKKIDNAEIGKMTLHLSSTNFILNCFSRRAIQQKGLGALVVLCMVITALGRWLTCASQVPGPFQHLSCSKGTKLKSWLKQNL